MLPLVDSFFIIEDYGINILDLFILLTQIYEFSNLYSKYLEIVNENLNNEGNYCLPVLDDLFKKLSLNIIVNSAKMNHNHCISTFKTERNSNVNEILKEIFISGLNLFEINKYGQYKKLIISHLIKIYQILRYDYDYDNNEINEIDKEEEFLDEVLKNYNFSKLILEQRLIFNNLNYVNSLEFVLKSINLK